MKISLLCLVLGLTVCIGEAAASRADLNFADNDDPAEITAALRHLTSTEDPNYNVIETNQDEGAVIAPAPKGAKLKKRSGRIAYGKPAAEGQFPTVVWLGVGEYICTGTLITKKAVMTAAHCVRTDSGAFINVKDVEVGFGSEYYDYTDAYTVDVSSQIHKNELPIKYMFIYLDLSLMKTIIDNSGGVAALKIQFAF